MSKRIPPNALSLDMRPDGIRQPIRGAGDDRLWEFLSLASEYSSSELDGLEHARDEDRERWNAARAAYADRFAELASSW